MKKGLSLPISGSPSEEIEVAREVARVGIVGDDFEGLKPTLLVKVGDRVQTGQPVFLDKKNPGVTFTSSASGVVEQINRGKKRKFESLVINVDGNEEKTFAKANASKVFRSEIVIELLLESGLWTAFRTRPYGKVPRVDTQPAAIFVTAMDTEPLAPQPRVIMKEKEEAFIQGVLALASLSNDVHVCLSSETDVRPVDHPNIQYHIFDG